MLEKAVADLCNGGLVGVGAGSGKRHLRVVTECWTLLASTVELPSNRRLAPSKLGYIDKIRSHANASC